MHAGHGGRRGRLPGPVPLAAHRLVPAGTTITEEEDPRAFFTRQGIDELRRSLPRHPDATILGRYYLISGRSSDAQQHTEEFLKWLDAQNYRWEVHGLSHYRQAEGLINAHLAEDILAWSELPAETRRTIMRKLTLWAHFLSEPDFNPRGAGVHLGNNNMTINRTVALAYFASLMPD